MRTIEAQAPAAALRVAVVAKDTAREQARLGGMMFAGFMLVGIIVSWLMYPFPLR